METKEVPPATDVELLFLKALLGSHPGAVGAVGNKLSAAIDTQSSPSEIGQAVNNALVSAFLLGALLAMRTANEASAELIKELFGKDPTKPKESMN